jgi:hypothetical protein
VSRPRIGRREDETWDQFCARDAPAKRAERIAYVGIKLCDVCALENPCVTLDVGGSEGPTQLCDDCAKAILARCQIGRGRG